ncbi:MAG: cupredoxin domain-containing protein [Bacillota bacterium]|nr:cupredoxin domain-containing protein [Bacillota bacterium]
MKKGIILLLIILSAGLLIVGCGGGDSANQNVVMDEPVPAGAGDATEVVLEFDPDTITPNEVTMKAGEKILFVITNTDQEEDHNFLDSDSGLKEILVVPGQTVRRLWTAPSSPGVYEPYCAIHPWIRMTFVVE